MNVRTTLVLAILLAFLGGYYYWSERRPKPETGNPKVFAFEEKAVEEVTIIRRGMTIAFKRDGDAWRMIRPLDAQADRDRMASLVAGLTTARIDRTVEEKPTALADFGLDPPAITVGFKVKDTAEPVRLLLGKNNPSGSGLYAKTGDSPAVLLIPANLRADLERSPADFRDKTIVSFDLNRVTRIEVKGKDATIVAAKSGQEWWLEQPLKTKADRVAMDRLLGAVRDLRVREFVTEKAVDLTRYGLTRPDYRVTVSEKEVATPKTVLVARKIGRPDKATKDTKAAPPPPEMGDAYVAVAGGKNVYLVGGRILTDLQKTPLDLRDKQLLAFETKDVKGIRVVWPEITIALEKDGDAWKMTEPQAAAAESGKALGLLYAVTGLRFKGIATEKPGDLAKYGLAKPQVEVVVRKTDNTDLPGIELGKADTEKNQLFARLKNSPTVYILEPRVLDDLPRDPAMLRKEAPTEKKD